MPHARLDALGTRLEDLLHDDAALTAFIGAGVGGVWHASGTARMGAAGIVTLTGEAQV
jgi:hypothetical protein